MKRDTIKPLNSSFLSCEKDTELILTKLFADFKPHANELKRLLVISAKDCLDPTNKDYEKIVDKMSVKDLIDNDYIKLNPKLKFPEHEEVKSYVIIGFDNFMPTENPEFRDCTISFDVICHTDYWSVGTYAQRPIKICGYIDGMLNEQRLTGIGKLQFLSCNELILSDTLSGYTLTFLATHGSDDILADGKTMKDYEVNIE